MYLEAFNTCWQRTSASSVSLVIYSTRIHSKRVKSGLACRKTVQRRALSRFVCFVTWVVSRVRVCWVGDAGSEDGWFARKPRLAAAAFPPFCLFAEAGEQPAAVLFTVGWLVVAPLIKEGPLHPRKRVRSDGQLLVFRRTRRASAVLCTTPFYKHAK